MSGEIETIGENVVQSAINLWREEAEAEKFREFESGRARTVFEVYLDSGDKVVLYLCTNEEIEERFKKEELLLQKVKNNTEIPVPDIYFSDFSKTTVPYLFYIAEKAEGYTPKNRFKYLPREKRLNIVKESAKYMAELHGNVGFGGYGEIIYSNDELVIDSYSWSEYLREWSEEWISELEGKRFDDLQVDAKEFLEEHIELAKVSESCCNHFDIKPDNLSVKDGSIEAILDWEKAISGAPEWDIQYSITLFSNAEFKQKSSREETAKEFLKTYLQERKLSEGWKKRIAYYNTIWMFKAMANLEEEIPENDKDKVEKEFRKILCERFNDLERASETKFPGNLVE